MSRQSEILNSTLEAVNKNNAITVSFSNREKIIIKNMMEQYGRECSQASLEKASEKTTEQYVRPVTLNYQDIKNLITSPENILLL